MCGHLEIKVNKKSKVCVEDWMRTALISGFTLGLHGTAPLLVHRKHL
jgi:hypothetical protein